MYNLELKVSFVRSGRKIYAIARDLDWHPTKISQIISGVYSPDEIEKKQLAHALGAPVEEIFPADPVEAA